MVRTHQVFAPPTWDGSLLTQDWRTKIPHNAVRRLAEDTWCYLLRKAGRRGVGPTP